MKYFYKSEIFSIPQPLLFIPLKDAVIFPNVMVPLFFHSDEALNLLNKVILENNLIGCVGQRDPSVKDPQPKDLLSIGTVCKVLQLVRLPNKGMKIFVEGLSRVFLQNITQEIPYFKAELKEVNESRRGRFSQRRLSRASERSLKCPSPWGNPFLKSSSDRSIRLTTREGWRI